MNKLLIIAAVGMVVIGGWARPTISAAAGESTVGFALSIVPECRKQIGGCSICDITQAVVNASNLIAGGLSGISLLMFIVGGFFFVFSGGNEQRIETGKKILVGTVTGLAVVFVAWFLINFVVRLAYRSSTGKEVTKVEDYQLFKSNSPFDWWTAASKCDPNQTDCAGKYIGDACGTSGDCPKDDNNEGACYCYRKRYSGTDKSIIDTGRCDIASTSTEPDFKTGAEEQQECYCAQGCDRFNATKAASLADYTFGCVAQSTVKTTGTYNIKDVPAGVQCPDKGYICAGQKN
ncbi:MAG: hypothetical protein HYV33_06180 [Candidatus Kerfeldbacteria bacterium]|nr:hypothetical protein [Candidatus Kerfeldbacteria bacterium]